MDRALARWVITDGQLPVREQEVAGSSPAPATKVKNFINMKKIIITIILAVLAIAALIWGLSYGVNGIAWLPGFLVAVFCLIKIVDVHELWQDDVKTTRR